VEEARNSFWCFLEDIVRAEYSLDGIQSVRKLEQFHLMINKFPNVKLCSTNNYIVRIWTADMQPELMDYRPGSGFFVESRANDLTALAPLLEHGCQTLSYYGVEKSAFNGFMKEVRPRGIDRIVPIGNTLDFSLTWDGYDIIGSLSRKIDIV
jgi:hypothetical protein